jgi:peptide/nickel transport system substrate-binding protein
MIFAQRLSRLARLLGPALLLAAALTAPVQAETVLRVVPNSDLRNIDPIWTTQYITRNHGYLIYDTLFALDEKLKPQPQMVESWSKSADGLTYTFTLRKGLKWHDGPPVTAADCVASLRRWGARDAMGQKLMQFTKSLEAVNAATFRLTLKEPFGHVIESLAKISSNVPFMMPERIAQTDPFTQIKENIGSGPFKFVTDQWVPGSKAVYVRNPDYVPRDEPPSLAAGGKRVYVDRVEWLYIPDPSTALAALAAGEVDYFENPPPDFVPLIERDTRLVAETTDLLGLQGVLRPNHLQPPFNNVKARQALLWMVKQEDYLRAIVGDPRHWKTCAAYFGCGTEFGDAAGANTPRQQDLDKARQLMREAGYNGELVVVLQPTDYPTLSAASLVTANLLRKIGVNVQVQALDWSSVVARRVDKRPAAQGGWSLFHTQGILPDVMSPIGNFVFASTCDKAWFGWPCSEELETVRDQFARATEPAEQKRLAVKLQELGARDVPYIPIGQFQQVRAYRKSLEGVINSPVPFFWNIRKPQ